MLYHHTLARRARLGYPCRVNADPAFHTWRAAAVPGWFVCLGCGRVGVCLACLDGPPPQATVALRCPAHALPSVSDGHS